MPPRTMSCPTPFMCHVRSFARATPNSTRLRPFSIRARAITVYAGAGCEGAHDEVVATAARLKAPMAHTSRGKDFVEYDNPYNVGMTGMIGGSAGYHAILDCDVLLLLGANFAWTQFYPDKATIIQIDADPTHIGRRHPVTIGAVGDIKTTLEALLPRLKQHEDNAFLTAHVERHRKDVETAKAETVSGPDAAISGTYLTKIINKHAADDALFAADDGTPLVWMLRHIDTNGKRRTFGSLLHGTMADGMPSALGLQKCQPGRQVICLAGDGGFSMLLGDLLTTVQENLPIKIAVYDNGKLGFIDIENKAAGMEPGLHGFEEPELRRRCESDGPLGTQGLEGRGTRGRGSGLARAARTGGAGCEGEADAAGDATVALCFAGGRRRDGGL